MEKENKTVFVIVREVVDVKERLTAKARSEGFSNLSEYVRSMWIKWL